MTARQYPFVLSNESLEWLNSRQEVTEAKARIQAKTSIINTSMSEYFYVPLIPEIRSELFEVMGLQLSSDIATIPMRWIAGDTQAHEDRGASSFSNTYLVYLTSSPGSFIVDGIAYPIQRGYGYVFSEGLTHETVGTTSDAGGATTPRLLLGPMSDTGFAVGGPQISRPGGTTVYIRQVAVGQHVEYSIDQENWFEIYWYSHIHNSNTAAGVLIIEFITDITIDTTIGSNNGYFICITDNIQIGSRLLKPDGTRPVITIDGVTNYPGFVQNGTGNGGGTNGYNNIYVVNLEIRTAGATDLVNGGGWFGQGHFGNNTTASSNIFINCHSTGIVSNNSGGIVGHYSGPIKCVGCSSSGEIHEFGGGIIGSNSPSTAGQLRCESCWTTGSIGHAAGGITGRSTGAAVIMNCYSSGTIAENAGGISGHETGTNGGGGNTYTVSECYSTGTINDLGGGIIGSDSGAVTITNCYSIGEILATGGGILGRVPGSNSTNKSITNCYTTGTTAHAHSYIVAAYTNVNTNLTVHNGTITLANNYSEAANASSGWSNTRANTVLTGVPVSSNVPVGVKWVYAGSNTPYELYMMGHTPYTRTVVSGAPTSPAIVRLFAASASAGTSTASALITTGRSYSILQISKSGSGGGIGAYPTITMDATTGAITTTRETALGTYTITLRNSGSYHITEYELTVTEAAAQPYNPCRCFGLFTNNAQVFYKSHSLASGGVGTVRNHRRKAKRT